MRGVAGRQDVDVPVAVEVGQKQRVLAGCDRTCRGLKTHFRARAGGLFRERAEQGERGQEFRYTPSNHSQLSPVTP